MLYQPEIITYLCLAPAIFMIVIPATLATLREIRGIMRKSAEKEEYITDSGAFAHA